MSTIASRDRIALVTPAAVPQTPVTARAAEVKGSMPTAGSDTVGAAIREALGAINEFVSDAQRFIAGEPNARFSSSLNALDKHVVGGLLRHLQRPLEALSQVAECIATNGTIPREKLETLVDAIRPVSAIIPDEARRTLYDQLR